MRSCVPSGVLWLQGGEEMLPVVYSSDSSVCFLSLAFLENEL